MADNLNPSHKSFKMFWLQVSEQLLDSEQLSVDA